MNVTLTAYKWVPPQVQGWVRDFRVRWACEEAGIAYKTKLVDFPEAKSEDYRAHWQPFGQVPGAEIDGLALFESGAIVLAIAEKNETLLPADPAQRLRAITWLFAALNSVEVPVQEYGMLMFYKDQPWTKEREPQLAEWIRARYRQLSDALGGKQYLEGDRFTIGDLMMFSVLRIIADSDFLAAEPNLVAYYNRIEARPAFKKAIAAQMADFEKR
jgi:glutathione S-transferase